MATREKVKVTMLLMAFVLMAFGSSVAAYQNLRWHCWLPGGGDVRGKYFYAYKHCHSRWGTVFK